MDRTMEIALRLSSSELWLAQFLRRTNPEAVENSALFFSGPQFFTALIAGVLLAFAFQLLLTNLGVAAGISLAGKRRSSLEPDYEEREESLGSKIRKISTAVGLGTLISVTIALFCACLLAVKLSLFVSSVSGAIVGLVIWATYFSLLVFFSSTTVGSLIGSVINTATSGFQSILGTTAAAIGSRSVKDQAVATAEALADTVQKKLGNALDPETVRENVEDYFKALRPSELNIEAIATELERLIKEENLAKIADNESLKQINRQTFIDLISNRTDLSKKDVDRIADRLESIWNRELSQASPDRNPIAEFVNYLQFAKREQLIGSDFQDKLNSLVEEIRISQTRGGLPYIPSSFGSLIELMMKRTDLSDLDINKVLSQLQKFRGLFGEQIEKIASGNSIKADVREYLIHAYPWQLKRENLNREFRDILYDPQADPENVATQLQQINRSHFIEWLEEKGILTQEKIQEIANLLEEIRQEVLSVAKAAQEKERAIALFAEVEEFLRNTPKKDLSPEQIQLNFKPILSDPNADYLTLSDRLQQFDHLTFERILEPRRDLNAVEASAIINELEMARDHILQEAKEEFEAAKIRVEMQWSKLQSYLRYADKEGLEPKAIKQELQRLLVDRQTDPALLQARKAQFDREVLVELLSQRQDLQQEQIEQIVDCIQDIWTQAPYTLETLVGKTKEQYQQAVSAIANYLRSTEKEELNPEGIKRDLTVLIEDPKAGFSRIKHRLAQIDRDTLVQLLSQRRDLSEEQANQIINQVQGTLESIAKAPRRFAIRTKEKVQDFQTALAEYLRSTGKEELNPEGIKRDLQLLIYDPRVGMENITQRLSHFDRDTLVALLSQREDISQAEANQVIDQILAVRNEIQVQLQSIQNKIQHAIDRILEKIRNYLNSLERPELNYEGIKDNIYTLLNDPQAGFEALRDRFSQIDRNTLIAILSSREDISKEDAERLVGQVEKTRDRLLQRAERIQREVKLRLEEVKIKAQEQLEETRKAAAVASWWLFFTALFSAVAAAGAGALAVSS